MKRPIATVGLLALLTGCGAEYPDQAHDSSGEQPLIERNRESAEGFIDAFYSFDPAQLEPFLAGADATAADILYYQGWARGGNYVVLNRLPCEAESAELFRCAITVRDDPVLALQTGFNVTDTFHLTFRGDRIASVETASNDQPIYYEARQWVEANMPEVMSGPCDKVANTPADCARAMTAGYRAFYAATNGVKTD